MKIAYFVLIALALGSAPLARAEQRGVIDDPDGYVNVRVGKSVDTAIIAKVKNGELFEFECEEDAEWCKVTLASGKSGWMHRSRIRPYFTERDLPSLEKGPDGPSEIDDAARRRGFDYAKVVRRAAHGDAKALKQFFSLAHEADGAAAEIIEGVPAVVYHLLGDEKFAKFLTAQPVPYRMMVRNVIVGGGITPPPIVDLRRHFPLTTKVLFQREMVGWFSPNDLYAIRKVFSDEFELRGSKVVRAELIEKKSGRILCDLTPDDIGTGAEREGEALWSADSKRVACLSSDLTQYKANLFSSPPPVPLREQTAVYQLAGDTFARVDLSLGKVPGREDDTELKGAALGHEYTEPERWREPNVLVLTRHEYYQKLIPTKLGNLTYDSVHDLSRWYEITVTIGPDGKTMAVWKPRED